MEQRIVCPQQHPHRFHKAHKKLLQQKKNQKNVELVQNAVRKTRRQKKESRKDDIQNEDKWAYLLNEGATNEQIKI